MGSCADAAWRVRGVVTVRSGIKLQHLRSRAEVFVKSKRTMP